MPADLSIKSIIVDVEGLNKNISHLWTAIGFFCFSLGSLKDPDQSNLLSIKMV